MELVFQAIIIVVIAAAAAATVYKTVPGMSLLLSIAAALLATISILTMIGESLCKDAGQAAGACAVQLVGVAAALYAALPLMRTFLTMIGECL